MTRLALPWLLSGALALSSTSAIGQSYHRAHHHHHSSDASSSASAESHHHTHHHCSSSEPSASASAGSHHHAHRHHSHRSSHHASQREERAAPAAQEPATQDLAEVVGALERRHVYAMRAPPGETALGAHGLGAQFWFVLPSCGVSDTMLPADACPIERLEIEAVGGTGAVHPGEITTVMSGDALRRVRAFAIAGAPLVRVQLVMPSDEVRYEGVVDAARFAELPPAAGCTTPQGFALDLARYPAR